VTEKIVRQLAVLLDVGITQAAAGRAVGVSTRSVSRFAARRRRAEEQKTLAELLEEIPSVEETLAALDADDQSARRPPQPWERAARRLAVEQPERWG
jgi:hypothetical protein